MKKILAFTPAQVGRASEDVALQIEAAIMSGSIQPGDSLPSERELQALFGTGRGVIREAFKALKQKGLIEIRKGAKGGAYIKQVDVSNVSESLTLFLKQHSVDPNSVIEFRESVDRTVTQLAIARASTDEKQSLVHGAEKLRSMVENEPVDLNSLGELDRELNIQLARMTHNPIFEWVMCAMQLGFSSHDYALYETQEYRQHTATNWVDTATAIAAGDPLRALSFVSNHYVLLRKRVDEQNPADRPVLADVTQVLEATTGFEGTEAESIGSK